MLPMALLTRGHAVGSIGDSVVGIRRQDYLTETDDDDDDDAHDDGDERHAFAHTHTHIRTGTHTHAHTCTDMHTRGVWSLMGETVDLSSWHVFRDVA